MKLKLNHLMLLPLSSLVLFNSCQVSTTGMVGKNVARITPKSLKNKDLKYSVVFNKKPEIQAPLKDNWQLKPNFKKVGDKHHTIFKIDPKIDLYGTGEVTGNLRRNGTFITLWNSDNFKYFSRDNGQRLYQSHPWVLGVRPNGTAFGIIFDTTWEATIDLTKAGEINFGAYGGDYPVYIMEGNTPQDILKTLANMTGKMELPPMWSLGYQQCKYSYYPEAKVKRIAKSFRDRKIPCDVIWIDIDYMDGRAVFTFDKKAFPDRKALNRYLKKINFKGVWMIDPGMKNDKSIPQVADGYKNDVWIKDKKGNPVTGKVWPGQCVFPDFTSPRVREWWAKTCEKFFVENAFDGVWNDMNEPAVFKPKDFPRNALHKGGAIDDGYLEPGIHQRYHNIYGLLMVKASKIGLRKAFPNKRPFILTRSNFLGGHRYAATWTGDNDTSPKQRKMAIPMVLNMGLSGQPFVGPDIPGFAGNTNAKEAAQWWADGALYPFARGHSSKSTKQNKERWSFGKKAENVARTAIERRYRLLPYFYTLYRNASLTGLPVMRPVFFADLTNKEARTEQESFLIGDNLLVIPRWDKTPPTIKGIWQAISILDDVKKKNDGYQPTIKQRGGSIVPIGVLVQSTVEDMLKEVTLSIVVNKEGFATGTLYEDNKDGYGYKSGDYLLTHYDAAVDNNNNLIISVAKKEGKRQRPDRKLIVKAYINGKYYTATGRDGKFLTIPLN